MPQLACSTARKTIHLDKYEHLFDDAADRPSVDSPDTKMDRTEVKELCYITAIVNVPSILTVGLLSHNRAIKVAHLSIAKQGVQDIRAGKVVPGGVRLHDYVNLYFNPRNPMMYYRKDQHETCCVLEVTPSVLDLPGVIVTDQNAARFAAFRPVGEGLALVDREVTFARYWTHPNPIEQDRRKAAQCADFRKASICL